MENKIEEFFKDDSLTGRISDELNKKISLLKCSEHGQKAEFIIYKGKFKTSDNCCSEFDDLINKEAKTVVERMTP